MAKGLSNDEKTAGINGPGDVHGKDEDGYEHFEAPGDQDAAVPELVLIPAGISAQSVHGRRGQCSVFH